MSKQKTKADWMTELGISEEVFDALVATVREERANPYAGIRTSRLTEEQKTDILACEGAVPDEAAPQG